MIQRLNIYTPPQAPNGLLKATTHLPLNAKRWEAEGLLCDLYGKTGSHGRTIGLYGATALAEEHKNHSILIDRRNGHLVVAIFSKEDNTCILSQPETSKDDVITFLPAAFHMNLRENNIFESANWWTKTLKTDQKQLNIQKTAEHINTTDKPIWVWGWARDHTPVISSLDKAQCLKKIFDDHVGKQTTINAIGTHTVWCETTQSFQSSRQRYNSTDPDVLEGWTKFANSFADPTPIFWTGSGKHTDLTWAIEKESPTAKKISQHNLIQMKSWLRKNL